MDHRLVHEASHHLAPRQFQQCVPRQLRQREALEARGRAAEIGHGFIQDRARLAATRALPPDEPGREAEAGQLVALADLVQDLARLIEESASLLQIAALGAREADQLERAGLLQAIPEAPRDVERALAGSVTSRPKLVALEPNALEDIWSDIRRVAVACGVAATGEEMVSLVKYGLHQ